MGFRSVSFQDIYRDGRPHVFLLVIMWATNRYVYLEEFRKYEVDYNVLVTNKIKSQFDFTTDIIRSTGTRWVQTPG